MGGFFFHFFSWGVALQVLCLIHFFRRRPDTFWLFVIVIGGALGAAVYIVMEIVPDLSLLGASVNRFSRKRRIAALQSLVQINPAVGNWEELADLLLEERRFRDAREIYDRIISPRTEEIDPYYRRAIAALGMDDPAAALPDLERVIGQDPKYDLHRAMGLLARACALTGQPARAERYFRDATAISTESELLCNYATFLFAEGRDAEAREWAKKVVDKQLTLPRYLRRRERPWIRRAKALMHS